MNQPEIYSIIKKATENVLQKQNNRLIITPETDFIFDLDFNYIDKITMITEVEQKTKIEVQDYELDAIETITDLIKLVEYKQEQNGLNTKN